MADPLSVTASAVSITSFGISLCKTVLDFYQSVKGSRRDVRELCEMIERLQRTLTEVEKVIQGSSHRDIAATAFENLEACKAGLDRLAHKMEKSRKVMTNSVARFPAALQYPFRESTIIRLREIVSHELLSHLNLSINILKLDVSEANHQSTQMGLSSINANIDSVRDETSLALSELKDGVSNAAIFAKSHDMGDRRDKVLRWISSSDQVADYHQRACEQREPHTGNWFIESDRYRSWKDGPGSFCWLYGIPGCGKTVLCSTIIEDIVSFCLHEDFKYVAYYYFSFKDAARQNAKSMLRSLMLQVLCQQSSVPEAVLDIYDGHEHEQPSQEALLKAFKAIIAKSGQFYIILDALDECPSGNEERAKLLSMLTSFKKFDLPTLHILVTSRKELDLIDLEDLVTDPPVSIQNKDVNNDILLHVRMQLRSNPKLCGWPKEIKDEIESKLAGGSHGMFRWASCQLELLRKCLRASTVKQTLQTLPRTLDDTYDRILLNIDQTYRKEAILALMWLLYSERPLSLRQLAEAMVIDNSAEPAFSPDDRFFSPESALNILSSLVSFTRSTRSRGPLLEIHLAHYSVKEYLTSARVSEGPAACFGIRHAVAQEQIVRGCLHYLRCCVPSDALAAMSIESEEPLDAPLYLYAARTWFVHAKKCGECITEGTTEMIINILEEPSIWSPYYNPEALGLIRNHSFGDFDRYRPCEEEPKPSKSHSALYYAACLGINEVVRYLLRHGAVVDEEFGRFGNALQAASLKGHMPVVITLVQGGANVNLQGGLFESAINAACFGGYAEIVKYLIERGARVDCEGFLGSPLDTLSRSQNPSWEILTTLLQKGALSFAKEKTKSWLMRWAAISGQEEVVRLLIDKMDISKKTSFKFTINVARIGDHRSYQPKVSAPYEAVFRRHEAVVKLLVEKWSNIGEQDSEGRTALYWACFLQCNGIVQMLLDHGADVHRPGPNQWVGRYWAALFDNQETLRLLNRVCDPSSCARCTAAESNAKAENESILDSVLTIWHCMEETSKTINNDVVPDDKYPKPHLRFN